MKRRNIEFAVMVVMVQIMMSYGSVLAFADGEERVERHRVAFCHSCTAAAIDQ